MKLERKLVKYRPCPEMNLLGGSGYTDWKYRGIVSLKDCRDENKNRYQQLVLPKKYISAGVL